MIWDSVEIRYVVTTCFGVFQKPFLIFMLGSAYKVENVILKFPLLCFSSAVNMLEDGIESGGPWQVWKPLVLSHSEDFNCFVKISSTEFGNHGISKLFLVVYA